MKRITALTLLLLPLVAFSSGPLILTWNEPPGFNSSLYSSTNLNGTWTPFTNSSPPVSIETTNQVAFFFVMVGPTNQVQVNPIVLYTNSPSAPSVLPPFTNQTALAYPVEGPLAFWYWSIEDQQWY